MCLASDTIFDSYMGMLINIVLLYITKDTVTEVGHWISGGAGPRGKDGISIHHWIFTRGRLVLNSGILLVP